MQKLGIVEITKLRELVEEVLTVCANDDTGVTMDLVDLALQAGEILDMKKNEMEDLLVRG